jgi:uncharacterized membrane protein YeaQ/YmgE (transglycosylase-associated protein family)
MSIVAIVILVLLAWFIFFPIVGSLIGFLLMIAAWAIAGWLVGRIMRGRGYSVLTNVALGLVGGIVGSIVLNALNLGGIGDIWLVGSIIVGVIGGVITVAVARLFKPSFAR